MNDPLVKEAEDRRHEGLLDTSQDHGHDDLGEENELDARGGDDEDEELCLVRDPTIHEGTASVYMSIVLAKASVAIASWNMSSLVMTFLQLEESAPYDLVRVLINQLRPSVIVAPYALRNNAAFTKAIGYNDPKDDRQENYASDRAEQRERCEESIRNEEQLREPTHKSKVMFAPKRIFDLGNAQNCLTSISITECEGAVFSAADRSLNTAVHNFLFDLSCSLSVRAVGGLISWVVHTSATKRFDGVSLNIAARGAHPAARPFSSSQSNVNARSMAFPEPKEGCDEQEDIGIWISKLEYLKTNEIMLVSPQTIRSLNILGEDSHPLLGGLGRAKEGLSLYGVLDRAVSIPGQMLLKTWVMRPLANATKINQRLEGVKAILQLEDEDLRAVITILRKIKNVSTIVSRFRNMNGKTNDWLHLHSSVRAVISLKEIMFHYTRRLGRLVQSANPTLHDLMAPCGFDTGLLLIVQKMEAVLDIERSVKEKALVIRQGVSQELDNLRLFYDEMDSFLTQEAVGVMKHYSERGIELPRLHVTYYPQIGFLLVFRKTLGSESNAVQATEPLSEQLAQLCDFQHMFSSGSYSYHKSPRMKKLDEECGDVYAEICDIESQIIRDLLQTVEPAFDGAVCAVTTVAEFDCLLSFASCAREYNWIKPEFNLDHQIVISQGRHPISELVVPNFVPNSFNSRGGHISIVTGPNFSGKSVYLKQVALIIYLAQLGCYVPAERADLYIVRRLFVQIRNFESASIAPSSFALDCLQLSHAILHANRDTLLIMDEFGKGTHSTDAISLNVAFIKRILAQDEREAPLVLLSTHLYEIFGQAFFSPDIARLHYLTLTFTQDAIQQQPSGVRNPYNEEQRVDEPPLQDNIVYLYRIKTVSPHETITSSHALSCAARFGVPADIVRRASQILSSVQKNGVIDCRKTSSILRARCERYVQVFQKLLQQGNLSEMNDQQVVELLNNLVA